MKVWVISWEDWTSDRWDVESVWDSEEAAQKEMRQLKQRDSSILYFLESFDVQS